MAKKYSKKAIENMVFSGVSKLSADEIKALIDKEMQKDADDIDMNYVDECFALLTIAEEAKPKLQVRKPIKTILIAAAIIFVFASTMTAMAYFNVPQKMATFFNGNAQITDNLDLVNHTADDYKLLDTDLAKKIEKYKISPVTLPEEIVSNSTITNIEMLDSFEGYDTELWLDFSWNNYSCNIDIQRYDHEVEGVFNEEYLGIKNAEMLSVNGMDVLVLDQNSACSVIYRDNLTHYSIQINGCSFDEAKQFAMTIK